MWEEKNLNACIPALLSMEEDVPKVMNTLPCDDEQQSGIRDLQQR